MSCPSCKTLFVTKANKQDFIVTVLVVQSHPSEKSFNEAILTRVISHLDAAGTDTTLIRLGKEKTILDINIKKPDSVIFHLSNVVGRISRFFSRVGKPSSHNSK